tara:strand:+ start:76 stop:480 length:405 start_codon:yes stop_codon:yes gene_type:complete
MEGRFFSIWDSYKSASLGSESLCRFRALWERGHGNAKEKPAVWSHVDTGPAETVYIAGGRSYIVDRGPRHKIRGKLHHTADVTEKRIAWKSKGQLTGFHDGGGGEGGISKERIQPEGILHDIQKPIEIEVLELA